MPVACTTKDLNGRAFVGTNGKKIAVVDAGQKT
jgi:hypothetical protein